MNPNGTPNPHVLDLIDAYVAGGLTAGERGRVQAHAADCETCAAALAAAMRSDVELRALFDGVRPGAMFEDRLIGRLRRSTAFAAPPAGWAARLVPRPLRNPMVRLAATGVAAAVVVGAVGLGMTYGANGGLPHATALHLPPMPWAKNAEDFSNIHRGGRAATPVLATGVDVVGGTTFYGLEATPPANKTRALPDPATAARERGERLVELASGRDKANATLGDLGERNHAMLGRAVALGDHETNGRQEWGLKKDAPDGSKAAFTDRFDVYYESDGKDRGRAVDHALHDGRASLNYFAGGVVDTSGLTKAGNGTVTLGGVNNYNGTTAVTAGTLKLNVVPSNTYLPGAVMTTSGGTLDLNGGGLATANQEAVTKAGGGGGSGGRGGFGGGGTSGAAFVPSPPFYRDNIYSRPPVGNGLIVNKGDTVLLPTDDNGPARTTPSSAATSAGGLGPVSGTTAVHGTVAGSADLNALHFTNGGTAAKSESEVEQKGKPGAPPDFTHASNFNLQTDRAFKPAELFKWSDAQGRGDGTTAGARGWESERVAGKPADEMRRTGRESEDLGVAAVEGKALAEAIKAGEAAGGDVKVLSDAVAGQNAIVVQKEAQQSQETVLNARLAAGDVKALGAKGDSIALATNTDGDGPADAKAKPVNGESTGVAAPATPPVATTPPAEPAAGPLPPPPPENQQAVRKIIRNGEMTFEVDSFDTAAVQIGKIATEERGYVSTTDSEKLPNGKVKGTIVVRCPPENLDTLVLKLRGLGDLKSQKINAEDVTKRYSDITGQLKAARAMEDRLLEIIKTGKGQVKDLIEAEKQLGVWREKIEALEGEIRYFNNLVALSTLSVTLLERDIKTPTAASEVETVQMGVETEDVEKSRADAIKAIEAAKGRVIEANVMQHEAGQLSATIVAEVPPDASGPVVDRFKQLGKVTRMEVERKQVATGGTGPVVAGLKVERKDTRFQVSLYNLANIAPRQTTSLNLAAADVEKSYRAILEQVIGGGGRVVSSQLNRPRPDETTGTISFQAPSDKSDVLLTAVRANGDVLRLDVTTNPDTQNVTDAKRGYIVQVRSLASVAARETTTLQLAATAVPDAFNKLLDAARAAGGRVLTSQLNEQDANNQTGQIDFEVSREAWGRIDAALKGAGTIVTRTANRSGDAENSVDSKIRLQVSVFDAATLQPRETVNVRVATRQVADAFAALLGAARDAGGRVVNSQLNQQDKANVNGSFAASVPRENQAKVEAALKEAGVAVDRTVARAAEGPMTVDTKVGFIVTIVDERTLGARETLTEAVVTPNVADRYEKVREVLRLLDAQVYQSQLVQNGPNDVTGVLDFAVRREDRVTVEKVLTDHADVFNRRVDRSQDLVNTIENKLRMQVNLRDAETQPARATFTTAVEVSDVEQGLASIESAAVAVGGRRVDATQTSDRGKDVARVVVDVPLARAGEVVGAARGLGRVTMTERTRNESVPEGSLSRARIEVTLGTPESIVKGQQSLWGSVRKGLGTSAEWLLVSLQIIITGLCVVVPWVLLVWAFVRFSRRNRQRREATTVTLPPTTRPPTDPPASPPPASGPGVPLTA